MSPTRIQRWSSHLDLLWEVVFAKKLALEDDEQFTYTLSSDDPVEFLASSGTVTIEDNDSMQTPALKYNSCASR